ITSSEIAAPSGRLLKWADGHCRIPFSQPLAMSLCMNHPGSKTTMIGVAPGLASIFRMPQAAQVADHRLQRPVKQLIVRQQADLLALVMASQRAGGKLGDLHAGPVDEDVLAAEADDGCQFAALGRLALRPGQLEPAAGVQAFYPTDRCG